MLFTLLALTQTTLASPLSQTGVTFKSPLAYIGEDGNVYITDMAGAASGNGQPVTADAEGTQITTGPFYSRRLNYRGLTWSSDGKMLAFVETHQNNTLTLVEHGKNPIIMTHNADSRFPPSFSPDGKEIAFVVRTQENGPSVGDLKLQIQAIPVVGGSPRAVSTIVGTAWQCEGGNTDPAAVRFSHDVNSLTAYPLYFKWLAGNRFLHTMGCNGIGIALSTAANDVWAKPDLVSPALSPDGSQLLAVLIRAQGETHELQRVDLATGKATTLETQPGVDRAIFSADGKRILYTTKVQSREIKGDASAVAGPQLLGAGWPYEGSEFTLTIWTMPAEGGTSTPIFKEIGQGIGFLSASPKESLVAFSLTSSMGKMVDAINAGKPTNDILALAPTTRLITVATDVPGLPNVMTAGGEPAFSPGEEFTVLPTEIVAIAPTLVVPLATPTLVEVATLVPEETLPTAPTSVSETPTPEATVAIVAPIGGNCPGFLASRLVVGKKGRVIPGGQWNRLRASAPSGAILTQIPSGDIFDVLEGPVCTSNNIAWWKVNYKGTVGWTAEGQDTVYWLEPYTETVTDGGELFGIVGVTAGVEPATSSNCPTIFAFKGQIVVNKPGTVTYRWERSDGKIGQTQTWNAVAGALTKDETSQWNLDETGIYWMRLHVLTPNNISSNQAKVTVKCGGDIIVIAFAVTKVTASVSPATSKGCPTKFTFTGVITSNGKGTVTYQWERSDGAKAKAQQVVFAAAGSVKVSNAWTLSAKGTHWQRLKIISPNALTSDRATFKVTCP